MHKFLNTEQGSSLVEMPGVLALIGVLSIGAVAGFPLYDAPDYFEIGLCGVSSDVCAQVIRDYVKIIRKSGCRSAGFFSI